MKKKILAAMLAALAVGAMALTGCSFGGGDSTDSDPVVENSAAASSDAGSTETAVPDIGTVDQAAFDAKFAANPIDAAYAVESQESLTNLEMVSLEEKFANLWIDEINAAYSQLVAANVEGILDDKKNWNDSLDSELDLIGNSVDGQGSLVRVERAMKIKNFFRDKAKALYTQLYALNPDYDYHYNA